MKTWSKLEHANILPLLGYTFDYGMYISLVSIWQPNGISNDFLKDKSVAVVIGIVSLDDEFPINVFNQI